MQLLKHIRYWNECRMFNCPCCLKVGQIKFFPFCCSWKMKKIIQNHCTLLASSQEVTHWLLTSCHRICIVWCQRSDPTQIRDYVFVSKQRTQRVLTGCDIKIYFCTGKHLQRENPDFFVQNKLCDTLNKSRRPKTRIKPVRLCNRMCFA